MDMRIGNRHDIGHGSHSSACVRFQEKREKSARTHARTLHGQVQGEGAEQGGLAGTRGPGQHAQLAPPVALEDAVEVRQERHGHPVRFVRVQNLPVVLRMLVFVCAEVQKCEKVSASAATKDFAARSPSEGLGTCDRAQLHGRAQLAPAATESSHGVDRQHFALDACRKTGE